MLNDLLPRATVEIKMDFRICSSLKSRPGGMLIYERDIGSPVARTECLSEHVSNCFLASLSTIKLRRCCCCPTGMFQEKCCFLDCYLPVLCTQTHISNHRASCAKIEQGCEIPRRGRTVKNVEMCSCRLQLRLMAALSLLCYPPRDSRVSDLRDISRSVTT